jgi:large subunit ribosomal protein L6
MEKKTKKKSIETSVDLAEGVQASLEGNVVTFKGPKGENKRNFADKSVTITIKDNKINLVANRATKREKKKVGSFKSHLKNMIKGVNEGFTYRLKICSGHFPMTVAVSGDEFTIQNFLGEKVPRKLKIKEGAEVKVEGEEISVEGVDKEIISQTAASIEQLTRISNRDRRIFQDGCYIIMKDNKEIK